MSIGNYNLFNEYAGKILAHLLEYLPMASSEPVGIVVGCKSYSIKVEDEPPKEWAVFRETVIWLKDEGFIRFGLSEQRFASLEYRYRLPNAKLTLKGLEALKSIPDPLNPNSGKSLADTLVEGAKDGAKGTFSDLTKKALSLLFTSMVA